MAGSSRSLSLWLRSAKVRHAFAISSVVLATGGLVLARAPSAGGSTFSFPAGGTNRVAFSGPGVRGTLALSQGKVLAGRTSSVYAELRVSADAATGPSVHAPTSLAVVLDTSGSMSGGKLEDAKQSILKLLDRMHDDDEIALVRYADSSEVIQPLARVGNVRSALASRIRALDPSGGTNIPGGLAAGLRAIDEAARGRVRRIVLVSDGLDATRAQAERLARESFQNGITVSSLGIGLDFDESYMGGVAQTGHGNFAFVKEGENMARFLERELDQTAHTTVERASIGIALPPGLRVASVNGATAETSGNFVNLQLGALFAGDERRVILELVSDGTPGDLATTASWVRVGGATETTQVPALGLVASNDAGDVDRSRDGAVYASAVSVLASKRQLEASDAYAHGDVSKARRLTTANEAALEEAITAAPAAAPALAAQQNAYAQQRSVFGNVPPSSARGKEAAKAGTASDLDNLSRKGKF